LKSAQRKTNNQENKETQKMKRNLLTIVAAVAIALGGFAFAQAGDKECPAGAAGGGRQMHRGHGAPLEHLSEALNLTPDQKAKVQPIIDQAKPQMAAIHKEAMEKMKALMDNVNMQLRPLLTPEQQGKLDEMKKAHEDMRDARKEMRDAKKS
jgi:Spy/CpxP family protein refolding chaperone